MRHSMWVRNAERKWLMVNTEDAVLFGQSQCRSLTNLHYQWRTEISFSWDAALIGLSCHSTGKLWKKAATFLWICSTPSIVHREFFLSVPVLNMECPIQPISQCLFRSQCQEYIYRNLISTDCLYCNIYST